MIRWIIMALALLTLPEAAQAQSTATEIAVVYDATTGAVDEVAVPTTDAELSGPLVNMLNVPNGVLVVIPISQVKALGFVAALAAAAPAVPTLQAQAVAALVAAGIAANSQAVPK